MMESVMINENLTLQLLVWEIRGVLFGVDIKDCLETKADVEIVPVPYSKSHIAGIANLRGEISLIYDLGMLLNQKKRSFQNKEMIVTLKVGTKSFSIIIDSIVEVIQDYSSKFKNASFYLSKEECEFVSHILDSELGLLQILNLEKIYNA